MKKTILLSILISISLLISGQQVNVAQLMRAMHSISSHDLLDYVKEIT